MAIITIGDTVQRLGSSKDYTVGRIGQVIAINLVSGRIRVHWTRTRSGESLNMRTWVHPNYLKCINDPIKPIA
jgi:hypothetical protein